MKMKVIKILTSLLAATAILSLIPSIKVEASEQTSASITMSVIDNSNNAIDQLIESLGNDVKIQYRPAGSEDEWSTYTIGTNLSNGDYEIRVDGDSALSEEDLAMLISLLSMEGGFTEEEQETSAPVTTAQSNETPEYGNDNQTAGNEELSSEVISPVAPAVLSDLETVSLYIKEHLIMLLAILGIVTASILIIIEATASSYAIKGKMSKKYTLRIDPKLKKKQMKVSKDGTFHISKLKEDTTYHLTIQDSQTKDALAVVKIKFHPKDSKAEVLINKGITINVKDMRKGIALLVGEIRNISNQESAVA